MVRYCRDLRTQTGTTLSTVAEPFCAGKEGDGDMYGCDVHREKADESRGQSHGSQREMGTHVWS